MNKSKRHQEKQEVLKLAAQGLSIEEIAKSVNSTERRVYFWVNGKHKPERTRRNIDEILSHKDLSDIRTEVYCGVPKTKIAKKYGLNYLTFLEYLRQNPIEAQGK